LPGIPPGLLWFQSLDHFAEFLWDGKLMISVPQGEVDTLLAVWIGNAAYQKWLNVYNSLSFDGFSSINHLWLDIPQQYPCPNNDQGTNLKADVASTAPISLQHPFS